LSADRDLITFDLVTTRDLRFTIRVMYRKPRFLEMLHAIREEMSREADYDVELFAEMTRTGARPTRGPARNLRGFRTHAPAADEQTEIAPSAKQRKRIARG
jgi:hypothetical protein